MALKDRYNRCIWGSAGAALAGVLLVGGTGVAAQDAARSVNGGVYTEAQANRGMKTFASRCTSCHDTARFTGDFFIEQWAGQSLYALYDVMRATMPEDNPGSLSPQQYADVLAYLLQVNAFPAGPDELEADDEKMLAVRMETRKSGRDR